MDDLICLSPQAKTPSKAYSFRNTPTRNKGAGAYENYFKDAIKITNAVARPLIFKDTVNTPTTRSTRRSVMTIPRKQPDFDDDYDDESGAPYEDSRLNESGDSMLENKTPSRLMPLLRKAKTPGPNATLNTTVLLNNTINLNTSVAVAKKKATVQRRSTICRSTLTPSLQKRTQSKVTHDEISDYEKARIKLHASNTPDCLPCREEQFSEIYTFIETNLKNQTGGVQYICGVPGTGKTLTVRQVILCLYESVQARLLPNFKFIDVNAFQVTEPHQIYKLIYKELTDENASVEHAMMLLEKKFEQKSNESIVLLVDELDMLCTKKQDVLYNLFEWPYKKNSKWIVITIANAMNLPEQVLTNKISSRLGLTRLNFQPYKYQELEEIVKCRLKELNIFDVDAIVYASRKVAAVSGDARRALEICRRATELAESENTFVSIQHVDLAIKQMFSSSKIVFLKHSTKYEQTFLKSITILYKATGLEETQLNKIFDQFYALCKYDGLEVLNRTQILNICNTLAACKLILIEPSKTLSVYMQRIRLNMSVDDIEYALKK